MIAPLLAGGCVAIALGVAASSATTPAPSFAGPRAYKAGKKPWRIAIADLNGDVRPDLAVTAVNHASLTDTVSVLTNRAGDFHRRRTYKLGKGPESLAATDLDGDGLRDLAIANVSSDTVSVLLNQGNGTFRPRRDYRTGGSPQSLAAADLSGDGRPDLAVANWYSNSVSVLLNRGDGIFAARRDYAAGSRPNRFAVADLNGDGRPDLAAAAAFTSSLSVLLNRGDGTFRGRRAYQVGSLDELSFGDLNGDGRPDVATANGTDAVSVSLNSGDGSFGSPRGYPTGRASRRLEIGDLNGDAKADLATANDSGSVSVLLNRGGATLAAPRNYRTGRDPADLAIADLDGDGRPELVTANRAGAAENTVTVLANRGGGTFLARNYEADLGPLQVAVGDLNGDRLPELVTANTTPDAVFVLTNATGQCGVPRVRRQMLASARREILRAGCRVGQIRRARSRFKRGRVLFQRPTSGALLPAGGAVRLVVSRGRRR
jgi:FG-GAP-like repeat